MLHIVKCALALQELNHAYQEDDKVLLIEDAVYMANAHHPMFTILKPMNVQVLEADAQARGILHRLSPSVAVVDYAKFVQLTAQHASSLTWG